MKKILLKMYMKTTDCIRAVLSDRRCCLFLCMVLLFAVDAVAGGGSSSSDDMSTGIQAVGRVQEQIAQYVQPVQKLMYAIAGVVAIVGAGSVYFKMQNGDQDVTKSIMMLIGACLFLCAAAYALPRFFGLGS